MSTAAELRELTHPELAEKLEEAQEELFNLRFQHATNQLNNTDRIRQVRREIARIQTVMREQEIEAWLALESQGDTQDEKAGRR